MYMCTRIEGRIKSFNNYFARNFDLNELQNIWKSKSLEYVPQMRQLLI